MSKMNIKARIRSEPAQQIAASKNVFFTMAACHSPAAAFTFRKSSKKFKFQSTNLNLQPEFINLKTYRV